MLSHLFYTKLNNCQCVYSCLIDYPFMSQANNKNTKLSIDTCNL